ncbi:MAG: hypothetical protein WAR83_14030, partial [Flavobacteriales bacterium]
MELGTGPVYSTLQHRQLLLIVKRLIVYQGMQERVKRKVNMLKTLLLYFTTLAFVATTMAQNLVPNPSFEDTMNCDIETQCMLLKAAEWYNPNTGTPDLFDADLDRSCGIPLDALPVTSDPEPRTGLRMTGALQWFGA